jgi:hypothetical protein
MCRVLSIAVAFRLVRTLSRPTLSCNVINNVSRDRIKAASLLRTSPSQEVQKRSDNMVHLIRPKNLAYCYKPYIPFLPSHHLLVLRSEWTVSPAEKGRDDVEDEAGGG